MKYDIPGVEFDPSTASMVEYLSSIEQCLVNHLQLRDHNYLCAGGGSTGWFTFTGPARQLAGQAGGCGLNPTLSGFGGQAMFWPDYPVHGRQQELSTTDDPSDNLATIKHEYFLEYWFWLLFLTLCPKERIFQRKIFLFS